MKKRDKILIKYSLIFIIFSFLGSLIEFIASLFSGKGFAYDQAIYLLTGLKLFFIPLYGLVGMIIFSFETLMIKFKLPLCIRGLIHGLTITIIELIFGYLGFLILKIKFWDYSNHFLNLQGYISLEMFLLWSVIGFLFSFIFISIKKLMKTWKN